MTHIPLKRELVERLIVALDPSDGGAQVLADALRSAIAAYRAAREMPSSQPTPTKLWVEARECSDCGHAGINDSHATDSCCNSCGWSGRTPQEDKCPGCLKEGTMSIACPKCSGYYSLITDGYIAAPATPPPAQSAPARCQYCDGTGDVHSITGEWRGTCTECNAAAPAATKHLSAGLVRDPAWRAAEDAAGGVLAAGALATQPEGQKAHPDLLALQRFAAEMMRSWPDAGVEGADLQDAAEAAGLLQRVDLTVPCGAGCTCRDYYDDGQTSRCYQVQPVLTRARAVQAGGGNP